ncbi:MAG: napG [Holophagaceae bacterium]|nr:napG [Holophagaceae bacterium]
MSKLDQPHGRGDFFKSLGKLVAGFVAEQVEEAVTSTSPKLLRPPGALDELAFLTACTRCDKCMLACPQGSIQTASPRSALAMGTPFISPRAMPCFLCADLPCIPACPDGALVWPQRTIKGEREEGPRAVQMGVAVVDPLRCLTFPREDEPALACQTCLDRCPFPEEAIRMVVPEEGGIPRPEVIEEACTGCGLCEFGCASSEASIRIEARR